MTEGVLLFTPTGDLAYANPTARTLLGRRFNSADSVAPLLLREAILEVRETVAENDMHEPATRQFETPDAVLEATALAAEPPGSVVVVLRDVTQLRSIERLRRDFVANASHELKTPVASILALAETLRTAARHDPDTMTRLLSRLEQEAGRLAALVRDLLELSRLEGGPLTRALVDLNHVVEAEAERARQRAESEGLTLLLDASDGDLVVSGSEADLTLLVHNLLDNAIRYTPEGGEISVSLSADDGEAHLTVSDTGIGIPARDMHRIFERFYRVDAARSRQTGGTGLGLSIVRNVADAHGGGVVVTSEIGLGSTFTVQLPLPDESISPARQVDRESGNPDLAP